MSSTLLEPDAATFFFAPGYILGNIVLKIAGMGKAGVSLSVGGTAWPRKS